MPRDEQGSWVNLCVDPKGRLIVSDQYGPLYRITPPAQGSPASQTKVEKLDLPLGEAHGLLWAFDSLYVMVNEGVTVNGEKPKQGLHRVRSKDGGDTFEKPEFLHGLEGGGEHGVHAILPGPDGKSLFIVVGDATKMVKPLAASRVPQLFGEDHLLPRMPDGNGFMANVLGPGGCIYKTDPDGKNWELVSTGYRNEFDAAFNHHGELFTYDADMEWDINTPWYRPTRVCLATSGSEFGWRNGAGKWYPYYPDSLPAIYNVGPGSPTGMCFGYGAKFPAKYQEALFMCDWSYGKLYVLHVTPDGSAYKGELEEFLNGSPLPLTDVVVNPKDGALYFTIGGRKTQSGLYRVTYTGKESTEPSQGGPRPRPAARVAAQVGGVPRQERSQCCRDRLAVPGSRGSLHPLRRPHRHRASGREDLARTGSEGDRSGHGHCRAARTGTGNRPGSFPPPAQARRPDSRPRSSGTDPRSARPHRLRETDRDAAARSVARLRDPVQPHRQAGRGGPCPARQAL